MKIAGKSAKGSKGNVNGIGAMNVFDKNNITPEQLQQMIDNYFNDKANFKVMPVKNANNTITEEVRPVYTIFGLVYYLGFTCYDVFNDWIKAKGIYSDILKRAKLKIAAHYETLAQTNNPVGAIFALKNIGNWTDSQTVNNVSLDGSMSPKPVIVSHSKEQDKDVNKEIKKLFVDPVPVN
jgi:hypothetical protein